MTTEEKAPFIEPYVHIQREEENGETGEGVVLLDLGETQVLDEGFDVHADPKEGTLQDYEIDAAINNTGTEINEIEALKTIDESLNEIEDSYWKRQHTNENKTKSGDEYQGKTETQNQTVLRESFSEAEYNSQKQTPEMWNQNHSKSIISTSPDHSHEALDKRFKEKKKEDLDQSMRVIKKKNKEMNIGDIDPSALERVKRDGGVPVILDTKGLRSSTNNNILPDLLSPSLTIYPRWSGRAGVAEDWRCTQQLLPSHWSNVGIITDN